MKRWLLAVLVMVACKQHSLVPDEEWTADDYKRAGAPATDHAWTPTEVAQTSDVIVRSAKDHPEKLPRFGGAKSGALFARLIEAGTEDPTADIAARFQAHLERFNALNALLDMYVPYSVLLARETFEILGVMFRESAALEGLAEPLMASFGPGDPKHESRRQGLMTMREGWAQMIDGALQTVTDTRISEANRRVLAGYIAKALPVFFAKLPADGQQKIRDRLAQDVSTISSGPLHDDLVAAQSLVR